MAVISSGGDLVTTWPTATAPQISHSVELFNGRRQDYAHLYKVQPNLRLVIRFLSRNIAQLGLRAYRRVSDTERVALPPSHKLAQFLANPTPSLPIKTSQFAWIRDMVEDLALYDELYLAKVRNADGTLNSIRVPPPYITPLGHEPLWPDGFRVTGPHGRVEYPANEIVYLHGFNPADPRAGLSSVESLRLTLAEEQAAGEWRSQFWAGAARMSGVVERPLEAPKWSDAAAKRWQADFTANYSGATGPGAGRTVVLEEGMTWNPSTFSPKDSEYLGSRRLSREETAAAYFIPPAFVGILENANFSNMREQHTSLYTDTLGPWMDWLTEDLELQLVPEFPDVDSVYLEFNIDSKMAGRFEEQAAAIQTSVGAPWMTRNEARALRNLPRIDGADTLVTPLNVLIGGQASPTDSAPTTVTAARAIGGGAKAGVPAYLVGWVAKHTEVLEAFVARQAPSVIARLGAGMGVDAAFDQARWDAELGNDLAGLALAMAPDVAGPVAARFGATFDLSRAETYLITGARMAAENINTGTREDLHASGAGTGDLDEARGRFDNLGSRVPMLATTRSTTVGQWSRLEAAGQAGAGTKTWRSSGLVNSRHGRLHGETVALDATFSNGASHPGDPSLPADDTAGCQCSLDFGGPPP